MAGALTVHRAGATVWCTLDRPPLNLLEPALIRTLRETFEALAADRATRIATVHAAPFPVIAALNGPCLGAGFELALACDLRVAAAGALLGLPEVRVGIPSVIQAALLPLLVGPGRAAELLLTGEPITAERAHEWGLVNDVVPAERLRAAVQALVERI